MTDILNQYQERLAALERSAQRIQRERNAISKIVEGLSELKGIGNSILKSASEIKTLKQHYVSNDENRKPRLTKTQRQVIEQKIMALFQTNSLVTRHDLIKNFCGNNQSSFSKVTLNRYLKHLILNNRIEVTGKSGKTTNWVMTLKK